MLACGVAMLLAGCPGSPPHQLDLMPTPAHLAYMKDIETARVSAWGLRQLLDFLARETSAERIHIIGYSAGSRVVLTALYELALIHQHDSDTQVRNATRLGNVILVGSDVDTGTSASHVIDGLLRVKDRLTPCTSPRDQALNVSQKIFAHRRLGQILPGTVKVPSAFGLALDANELADAVNEWVVFATNEGMIERAYDYWILGQGAVGKTPRWSIIRNVPGRVD